MNLDERFVHQPRNRDLDFGAFSLPTSGNGAGSLNREQTDKYGKIGKNTLFAFGKQPEAPIEHRLERAVSWDSVSLACQ